MAYYDCTYVATNPYDDDDYDPDDLANRAYIHMADKAQEGWRLVSTVSPPGTNAIFMFWDRG